MHTRIVYRSTFLRKSAENRAQTLCVYVLYRFYNAHFTARLPLPDCIHCKKEHVFNNQNGNCSTYKINTKIYIDDKNETLQ